MRKTFAGIAAKHAAKIRGNRNVLGARIAPGRVSAAGNQKSTALVTNKPECLQQSVRIIFMITGIDQTRGGVRADGERGAGKSLALSAKREAHVNQTGARPTN